VTLQSDSRARARLAHIDWPRLLGDIQYLLGEIPPGETVVAPVGQVRLSAYLGVSRGTVRRWIEEDAEPRHHDGEHVIAAWMSLTGKRREYLPIRVVSLSAAKLTA